MRFQRFRRNKSTQKVSLIQENEKTLHETRLNLLLMAPILMSAAVFGYGDTGCQVPMALKKIGKQEFETLKNRNKIGNLGVKYTKNRNLLNRKSSNLQKKSNFTQLIIEHTKYVSQNKPFSLQLLMVRAALYWKKFRYRYQLLKVRFRYIL